MCSRTGTHSFTPTQARALPPTHGTCTATFTSTNTNSMFNFLPTPRAPIKSLVSHSTLLLLWQASHTVRLQDTHAQGLPLLSHTSFNRTRAFLLRQYPIFSIPPYQPPPPSLPSAPDEPRAACPTYTRQLSTQTWKYGCRDYRDASLIAHPVATLAPSGLLHANPAVIWPVYVI